LSTAGEVWKDEALVRTYLDGIRDAIPLAREQIEVMLRLVESAAAPVQRFADLGCGNGVLSRALLDRYPGASATLVDFSQPMMEEARTLLAPYGTKCRFIDADLSAGEWVSSVADATPFDVIVSGYAIHHLADERKRKLYLEIFDLLKPGGLFVNTEHVKSATPWVENISDDLLIDSFYEHQLKRGLKMTREQVAEQYVNRQDKHDNMLALAEDQCRWLRECGFEDVDCYFKIFELAIFGGWRPASR
jgi:ubiquinone/menaquinone biosynthesis C-methylase UbiE